MIGVYMIGVLMVGVPIVGYFVVGTVLVGEATGYRGRVTRHRSRSRRSDAILRP